MDSSQSVNANQPQYTTYITTWGPNPVSQVQNMINNGTINSNTTVDISFASYNWDPTNPNTIPGFQNTFTSADLKQIVALIHNAGGKVGLSIGGANSAYNYYGSTMYGQPWQTATYINNAIHNYGFDSVDFDVEDSAGAMPADFATQQAEVINTLRSLNSSVSISLTLPAQAWGSNDYQRDLLNLTMGAINTFAPMEYSLWLAPGNTYAQQIQSDINYYINEWKVPPGKISLGLMPGSNAGQDLSLNDATQLAQWAVAMKLQGVMTWDSDNDAGGIDGNPPFAYTKAIEAALGSSSAQAIHSLGSGKGKKKLYSISPSTPEQQKTKGAKKRKGPPDIGKKI